MEIIGYWWNDRSIDLVEIDGRVFALDGWNGESYCDCWECIGESHLEASPESYTLQPIYRCDAEGIDPGTLDEGSEEWDRAFDIVNYDVSRN